MRTRKFMSLNQFQITNKGQSFDKANEVNQGHEEYVEDLK
jgi:hypothetical protein